MTAQRNDPGYLAHELETVVSDFERWLLRPDGREELRREIGELTILQSRLYDVLFAVRPRSEKAA